MNFSGGRPPIWIERFIDLAKHVAQWSKDSTKVGAVAIDPESRRVLELGFNGPPRGVCDLPERFERPAKYLFACHAEQNLVAHAARSVLEGATIFVTHHPCADCAKLLINAGVKRIVVGDGETSMPTETFVAARTMLDEAGIEIEQI
jgi:dCMP deaminase